MTMTAISVLNKKAVDYWHNDCEIYTINSNITVAVNKKRRTVVYVGEWDTKTNLPHGQGKQYKSIGNCTRDGYYHIDNTLFSCGKVSYKGEWKYGCKHGFGYNWISNGYMYKGNWENNQYNGYGTLYDSNKKVEQKGTWKNGNIFNGIGKKKMKDNVIFLGEICNGYITSNGSYYDYDNQIINIKN